MKLILISIVLSASVGFCTSRRSETTVEIKDDPQRICFECDPVPPEPTPSATPTPSPEPFQCFYVVIDGEKRLVCE